MTHRILSIGYAIAVVPVAVMTYIIGGLSVALPTCPEQDGPFLCRSPDAAPWVLGGLALALVLCIGLAVAGGRSSRRRSNWLQAGSLLALVVAVTTVSELVRSADSL